MSDSEGYPIASDGYRVGEEDGSAGTGPRWPDDAADELREVVARETAQRGEAWAARLIRDWKHNAEQVAPEWGDRILTTRLFLDGLLENDRWPRPKRRPAPELPKVSPPPADTHTREVLVRQVNVRLREADYLRLVEVADRYGLPGTTLARLFITRGLEAALQ